MLADTAALETVLEALCGVTAAKEADEEVRVSLAESVEMLVRPLQLLLFRFQDGHAAGVNRGHSEYLL